MRLVYDGRRYIVEGHFVEMVLGGRRDEVREAGFSWDRVEKVWYAADPIIAARLLRYADAGTHARLQEDTERRRALVEDSRATSAELDVPAPEGLDYMPFQKAGIKFILDVWKEDDAEDL